MEIRLLLDHRNDLVAERTRTINRLRWHLVTLCPELEASLKRKALNDARGLDRVDRYLRKLHSGAPTRIAHEQIAHLRGLNRQIEALHRELAELVCEHRPRLLEEQGCGALTAAILIGHTAGNERFRSEASFAKQTGTAPISCSSGKRTQHRLNRGGDRQLNHALHIIAITRAQPDPATKEYLARKEAEGKTTKGALRSLKRYLARHFHQLLAEPPANDSTATDGQPIIEPHLAAEPELPPIPPPSPTPAGRPEYQEPGTLPDGLHRLVRPRPDQPRAVLRPAAARKSFHRHHRLPEISAISPNHRSPRPKRSVLSPSDARDDRPATDSTPRSSLQQSPRRRPGLLQRRANTDRRLT